MGARCVRFDDIWRLSIIHAVRKVRRTGERGRFGTVLIVDTFVSQLKERTRSKRTLSGWYWGFGRFLVEEKWIFLLVKFRVCDTGMMCVAGCFDCATRSFDYVVVA